MNLLAWASRMTKVVHAPMPVCSQERHDGIKATAAEFNARTVHLGHQDDGANGLMRLATCAACGSTLVAPECRHCLRDIDACVCLCSACGVVARKCICGMGA